MKKTISFLALIMAFNMSVAQLTVTNSHYIFAKDIVVFVEDDLKLNNSGDYFYLRDGAQLIQGAGVTGNSGIGQLSVYQSGVTNEFAHSYWASPVGNNDDDNSVNRGFIANNVFYDVTTAPITSQLANYTPGYDGSSNPLVIADYWLYSFNAGANYAEWDQFEEIGELPAGYGFTMKGTSGSGSNQLYDFRGKPNTGTITVGVADENFTLVGNPYPSALDYLEFIHDTPNITAMDGTLYFWEQDPTPNSHYQKDYQGGYATYTITSDGVTETFTAATFYTFQDDGTYNGSVTRIAGSKEVFRYAPIGQGFMIVGRTNGTVRFTNSMRAFQKLELGESEYFKNSTTKKNGKPSEATVSKNETLIKYNDLGFSIVPEPYKRFRVNVDFDDVYTRQLVQTFHDSATPGFDRGLESKSVSGLYNDAYWISDEGVMVAQAFKYDIGLKIPLTIYLSSAQMVNFRSIDIQNFDESEPIYLHDIENDVYYDLKKQDVEFYLDAKYHDKRFEITFVNHKILLDVGDKLKSKLLVYQNNGGSEIVILNPDSLGIRDFQLYDVSGRLMMNKQQLTTKSKHKISTENLSPGIYFVNIKLATSDILITKKILVTNN